jgi:hypothetical protein
MQNCPFGIIKTHFTLEVARPNFLRPSGNVQANFLEDFFGEIARADDLNTNFWSDRKWSNISKFFSEFF